MKPIAATALPSHHPVSLSRRRNSSRWPTFSSVTKTPKAQNYDGNSGDTDNITTLVIADLHWADQATVDLLRFVLRRIRRTGSLVVGVVRDDEIGLIVVTRLELHRARRGRGAFGARGVIVRVTRAGNEERGGNGEEGERRESHVIPHRNPCAWIRTM